MHIQTYSHAVRSAPQTQKPIPLNTIISALFASLLLTACQSPARITSDPTGADVRRGGNLEGSTPFHTEFSGRRTYLIEKEGFVSKSVAVQPRNSSSYHVVLDKFIPKVTLTSRPDSAAVYDANGSWVGQTPLVIEITEEVQEYTVSKLSYPSKRISLTPSSPQSMRVDLGEQISGMVLMELVNTNEGVSLQTETVYADRDVIETSPAVRAVRRMTDLSQTRYVNGISLFPAGNRIMIEIIDQQLDESGRKIHYSNLWSRETGQVEGLQRWTDGRYFDEAPSFSADGNHIYFSSTRSGKMSVFRMSTAGQRGLGLVTTGATLDRFPQISPDGATLIWTAFVPGTTLPQQWSLPLGPNGLQSGLPMQLREGSQPKWSPDGRTLLFSSKDRSTGKWKIWTMRPDGSEPTQITTGSDSNDIHPQWFPDGKHIIFSSDRGMADGKPNYDIWVIGADGSDPQQLTTNGSRDDLPIISHDGRTVYFRSNRGLKWDIWTMEIAIDL